MREKSLPCYGTLLTIHHPEKEEFYMGKIKNAVTTAKNNIKDWWSDPDHQAIVGIMGATVVGGLSFFTLGRNYGRLEYECKVSPEIMKLLCVSGELAGENKLLREMLENATSK